MLIQEYKVIFSLKELNLSIIMGQVLAFLHVLGTSLMQF